MITNLKHAPCWKAVLAMRNNNKGIYHWPLNSMGLSFTGLLICGFFSNTCYYSTIQSVAGWILRCGPTDTVAQLWSYTRDLDGMRASSVDAPDPCVVQGSTVIISILQGGYYFIQFSPSTISYGSILVFCFFFLAAMHSMWDLSSLTRDGTCHPCIGSTES